MADRIRNTLKSVAITILIFLSTVDPMSIAQESESLSDSLSRRAARTLGQLAEEHGDAARGALLYYDPEMTCVKCHEPTGSYPRLGPELAAPNPEATAEYLIDSLLHPSKKIAENFETTTVLTTEGLQVSGLIRSETEQQLVLVDPAKDARLIEIDKRDIEDRRLDTLSAMPVGLANQLGSEQQFLDLVKFLIEINEGGESTVLRLRPPSSMFAVAPLPEYENDIDHAGMIGNLSRESYQRGEKIFSRFCARCHGTVQQEGTMPTAMRFAESSFKNGSDPYRMYQTLTHGYGLMVPQRWMVPQQKYDVVHYIRETFLKPHNPQQLFSVNSDYLASLPEGSQNGPAPIETTPWSDMDYGPSLINTYEVGDDGNNIAYKGIAVRLDEGPGGVSQGGHWMLYDHDTMRLAAAWSGQGFIDWNGIHFNDQHQVHPRIVGQVSFANDNLPGWANPATGQVDGDARIIGRDGKRYGPLPADWVKFRGLYHFQDKTLLKYSVGQAEILEMPALTFVDSQPVFMRTLNIGARDHALLLRVASLEDLSSDSAKIDSHSALFSRIEESEEDEAGAAAPPFDGRSHLVADQPLPWTKDLTILARIKTTAGGTLICQTKDQDEWVPGGKTLFVRGGHLVFDVGWVGAVTSRRKVDDGQWHSVGMTWRAEDAGVDLFIDGELDRTGQLGQGDPIDDPVVRIGFTADNFPKPQSNFEGQLEQLRVWNRRLSEQEIQQAATAESALGSLIACWRFPTSEGDTVSDISAHANHAHWRRENSPETPVNHFWARLFGMSTGRFRHVGDSLFLEIPASKMPTRLLLASGGCESQQIAVNCLESESLANDQILDLSTLTHGSARRWDEDLTSTIETSFESGPFAVDRLSHPIDNPWACRLRLTGLDFGDDANTAIVCAWDGSVWSVSGFLEGQELVWKRIACGLFQPLGVKVIRGKVHISCRDQIVILHDLNGDEETDFYECFNSDHQVTEHFHEFAMGLQADGDGNLYYAKSARHAKTPLVPHHGTLLKVDASGDSTEIVAVGFRAANGVCINPDGSFFVTDQEGHWHPKNRINWVRPGGFYGNMWGYHDITDTADQAMEQPLCWITNAFDRSPGELMWVESEAWGPLNGALLNLSYGQGQIFVVPHETVSANQPGEPRLLQGGMNPLPIPLFPTGVMRGRFNPSDGQLYCCGMYAWAGNQQQPGGFYRVRYTGKPVHLPLALNSQQRSIRISFSGNLDPASAEDTSSYLITAWDIKRSANYGSPHFNEHSLTIDKAVLMDDGRTVELTIPDLAPTRCMEIKYSLRTDQGEPLISSMHNTIHVLPKRAATPGSR